jgi:hypothetical protein
MSDRELILDGMNTNMSQLLNQLDADKSNIFLDKYTRFISTFHSSLAGSCNSKHRRLNIDESIFVFLVSFFASFDVTKLSEDKYPRKSEIDCLLNNLTICQQTEGPFAFLQFSKSFNPFINRCLLDIPQTKNYLIKTIMIHKIDPKNGINDILIIGLPHIMQDLILGNRKESLFKAPDHVLTRLIEYGSEYKKNHTRPLIVVNLWLECIIVSKIIHLGIKIISNIIEQFKKNSSGFYDYFNPGHIMESESRIKNNQNKLINNEKKKIPNDLRLYSGTFVTALLPDLRNMKTKDKTKLGNKYINQTESIINSARSFVNILDLLTNQQSHVLTTDSKSTMLVKYQNFMHNNRGFLFLIYSINGLIQREILKSKKEYGNILKQEYKNFFEIISEKFTDEPMKTEGVDLSSFNILNFETWKKYHTKQFEDLDKNKNDKNKNNEILFSLIPNFEKMLFVLLMMTATIGINSE